MIWRRLFCLFVVLSGCIAHAAESAETSGGITVESIDDRGGGSYDLKTGVAVFTNRAIARYSDASLTADIIQLSQQTGEAVAEGDVIILRDGINVHGLNTAATDRELRLRGKVGVDDRLLADTRESAIAAYLDGWKRRIERAGTLNFPNEARRSKLSGNPVVEVAVLANGKLDNVVVRRTSGHRELDNAAVAIVRLAAPFDPCPTAVRERYPMLRFAYEWQFLNGRLAGDGSVFTTGP